MSNSVLNVKGLVGTFNQEKALVGAFSLIVKSSGTFRNPSFQALAESEGTRQFMNNTCGLKLVLLFPIFYANGSCGPPPRSAAVSRAGTLPHHHKNVAHEVILLRAS